jgi:Putative zinc-finger
MGSLEFRHPESDLLLPYLDGELPARKARQVRRHVEACWQCRTELEELQTTVGECVRYRKRLREMPLAQPAQPWSDLSREFAAIDRAAVKRPLFSRPLIRWMALAASSAALVAATLTFRAWDRHSSEQVTQPQPAAINELPNISSPASTPRGPVGIEPLPTRAPRREPLMLRASLADELRAVAALHALGADLGDPVEVDREGGRVVVRGSGVSPVRERQIRQALASLANVEIQFPVPSVLAAPGPAEPAAAPDPSSLPTAIQSRLEAQLGGHTQFQGFSAQLLDHQEAAMARIFALRRLATEFPVDAENQLSSDNQTLLRNLAREHLQAMAREIAAIRGAAGPVLEPLTGNSRDDAAASQAGGTDWQNVAETIFTSGRQVDSLLAALLGASAPEPGQADNLPRSFLSALSQLQASVQQCERLLTR